MQSMIRWTNDDRANLQKAINNFNAKIRRLKNKGYKDLPDIVSYEQYRGWVDLQDNEYNLEIYSRKQLNNVLASLKGFTKRGAELKIKLPSGQEITKWEYEDLKKKRTKALRVLNKNLEAQEWAEQFGMGSGEAKVTRATIKGIKNLEKTKGFDLKLIKQRINTLARSDRNLQNSEIFRRNFMNALEEMDNYDNIEILKKKLNSIKNPQAFYDFVKDSKMIDLFMYYQSKGTDVVLAGYNNSQEAFNSALVDLGLLEP